MATLALYASCSEAVPPTHPEPLAPTLFRGCEFLDEAGICGAIEGHEMVLWFDITERPRLEAHGRGDDVMTLTEPERHAGGWRSTFTFRDGWKRVVALTPHREFALNFSTADLPDAVDAARRSRAAGDLGAAEAHLDQADARDDAVRGLVEGMRARLAFSRGDDEACLAHYAAAAPFLERAGLVSQRVSDGLAEAFVLHRNLGRVRDAEALLDSLEPLVARDPMGRIRLDLTRGTLQLSTGDLRGCLAALGRASRDAERLGAIVERAGADELRADALMRLGRADEADAIMAALAPAMETEPPCTRATYLLNAGVQPIHTGDPGRVLAALPTLEEARRLFATECRRPTSLANAHLNLARALLLLGADAAAASAHAAAREVLGDHATLEVGSLEVELELALRRSRADEALPLARTLEARASAAGWLGSAWEGALGRGLAERQLGHTPEAARAFDDAERLLDRLMRRLPLDGAQGLALSEHEVSARERVRLALAEGEPDEAFRVARHARRRHLAAAHRAIRVEGRTPEALELYWDLRRRLRERTEGAWSLPADQLAETARRTEALEEEALAALDRAFPPLPEGAPVAADEGELTLVLFPLDDARGQLAVLARLRGQTRGRVSTGAMLRGLDDWLEDATAIRVLAHGSAAALDVHLEAWRDAPLGAQRVVTYGLDGPAVDDAVVRSGAWLVVGDPSGDLDAARREADEVTRAWRRQGATVQPLLGAEARHEAVVAALAVASRFHYAGHGEVLRPGLWGSGLRLGRDERLTTADVLALPSAPRSVVLTGCETGQPSEGMASLGLAQAFVAAGARWVVGSTRPVDDAVAARVGRALGSADPDDWGARLRDLLAELGAPAAAFRLYVS